MARSTSRRSSDATATARLGRSMSTGCSPRKLATEPSLLACLLFRWNTPVVYRMSPLPKSRSGTMEEAIYKRVIFKQSQSLQVINGPCSCNWLTVASRLHDLQLRLNQQSRCNWLGLHGCIAMELLRLVWLTIAPLAALRWSTRSHSAGTSPPRRPASCSISIRSRRSVSWFGWRSASAAIPIAVR